MWAILLSACGRNIDPDEAGTTLVPTIYDDLLRGSSEIDSITGLAGNDTIYGFGGNDQILAGDGDDTIYLSTAMSIIEGGNGTDTAVIRAFDGFVDVTVDLKYSTYYVQSKLEAQDGQDLNLKSFETITIEGNVAATLRGTINADTLIGDDGADTIEGRAGADTLTGGNRQDTFVFTSGDTGVAEAEADTITDFVSGNDLLNLASIVDGNIGTYVEVNGAANNFTTFTANATASFTGSAIDIYVEYNLNGSGNTYLAVDENSSGYLSAGDTLIILSGLSGADAVDSSDFI